MNKPQQFVVLVDSKNSQERQTNSRYSMADSNSAADLCPEKATELRRGDSGFFSAGTTPLTPYKELNGLAQNGTMTEESRKLTAKAIPSDVSWNRTIRQLHAFVSEHLGLRRERKIYRRAYQSDKSINWRAHSVWLVLCIVYFHHPDG